MIAATSAIAVAWCRSLPPLVSFPMPLSLLVQKPQGYNAGVVSLRVCGMIDLPSHTVQARGPFSTLRSASSLHISYAFPVSKPMYSCARARARACAAEQYSLRHIPRPQAGMEVIAQTGPDSHTYIRNLRSAILCCASYIPSTRDWPAQLSHCLAASSPSR